MPATEGTVRGRAIALVVIAALALASIAGWWYGLHGHGESPSIFGGRAGSGAIIPSTDPQAAFAALDCLPRLLDDRPALAVLFSQPLDAKQKLADYLRVTDLGAQDPRTEISTETAASAAEVPRRSASGAASGEKIIGGDWTVGDNPRLAYFPYITAQRRFRIELKPGLKSVDGVALAAGRTCEVASEPMPPSFFFASRGVVLPAGQNGGLPVVTVNVPEVDVQFLRIDPAAMPRFFEKVATARRAATTAGGEDDDSNADEEEGRYWRYGVNRALKGVVSGYELDQLHSSAQSVHVGRYVTDDQRDRRKVSFLPIEGVKELQQPGVYVAVMAQPGRFKEEYQTTYFYVSDIGLQARRYAHALDAFATSLKSGEAMAGIEFELLDVNARSLGKTRGDADGHAAFANLPDAASLLLARRGASELSVIVLKEPGLDLSEFDVGGHPSRNTKLFAYAGRDLYRPGESFTVSVLARDADGHTIPPLPIAMTLKRPDGRTVLSQSWRPDEQRPGYLQHGVALPADAQTGRWNLELRADPGAKQADALWSFQVEEFLPERMKLDLKTAKPVLGPSDEFEVEVQGDYLFGAPAAGNRLVASAATERARYASPQAWPGFIFGDFADDDVKSREDVSDEALDDHGAATVTLPVKTGSSQSPLLVRGSFSLLESGGRPVVRSIERIVWPADKLIAVRPLFDRDVAAEGATAAFEVIRVAPDGKFAPLASSATASATAPVRLIREDRQYYWRFDDQKGWHSGYTETDEPVQSVQIALTDRAKLTLPVGYGRYRVEIDDPETGKRLRYRFYAGWGAQDAEEIGNRPDRVQLKLAGAPFKSGDTAQITITPPHDGQALVTVEGDRLLWSRRIAVAAAGTTIQVPIDSAWARHDFYLAVTAFRPGSQGERVTPARAVGLAYLPLARDDRKLQVAIDAPTKVLPEQPATVKLHVSGLANESNKAAPQQATVTLSAVDAGILNITRYAPPDPNDFFFGKHRYAGEIDDLYGKLIEKLDGSPAKLKFGGDSKMRDTKSLPKKVKLVDLFSGPVAVDAQGNAEVRLDIPDFNGTLKLMAVVSTADRFGHADAEMVAAAPIVAELATPRFISPGDTGTLALDVTNLSGAPQTLSIKLEGADPVRIGNGERSVTLQNQQRSTLRFPVEATDAYGMGRLRLQVDAAGAATPIHIVRESVLQVQPPVPLERDVRRVRLDPGGSLKLDASLVDKYFKASATVSVTVSNQPPLNVNRLVQGLLDYPYGCLEQTTSAAYPHLFIDEAGAKAYGLKPRTRAEREAFVDGAIGRLTGLQKANGGFTLWGDGSYETWLSAYVVGFLQDARAEGFSVPDAMFRKSQDWLLQQLQQAPNRFPTLPPAARGASAASGVNDRDVTLLRDSHQRFAELAHAAYVLARDQKAPLATLRLLHDEYRDRARSPLPLVHLSLALKLMGDEARAEVALDDAMQRPYGITLARSPYDGWALEWLGDYGTPVRDLAMSYALLVRHNVAHARRENLLFDTADRLGGRRYLSTQERLALFLAARAAGGQAGASWAALLKTGDASEALDSKSSEQRTFDAAALAKGVALDSKHDKALFVEIEAAGYPLKAAIPNPAKPDAIELKRAWFKPDGTAWGGGTLKVGDLMIVRVQARSPRQHIEDALVIDRIPAGFEVENLNLSQGPKAEEFRVGNVNVAEAMADARLKHHEYRDDRYVAAARLEPTALNVFYMVRVVTPGRYVVPAPYAEDMYRPELRGNGIGVGAGGGGEPFITIEDPRATP